MGAEGYARTRRSSTRVTGPGAAHPHRFDVKELPCHCQLLSPEEVARALRTRDLTDPTEGAHGMQRIVDDIVAALVRAWRCGRRVHRGARIVSVHDNYDALGYTPDAVTRDARYTRYVSPTEVLRSHTSALVPGALRGARRGSRSGRRAARVPGIGVPAGLDRPPPLRHPAPARRVARRRPIASSIPAT